MGDLGSAGALWGIQALQQIEAPRDYAGFHTVGHVELPVYAFELGLNGIDGNDQGFRYFLVEVASGKELEHPQLLRAQVIDGWARDVCWRRFSRTSTHSSIEQGACILAQ